jgi:phytoene desaturase
MRDVVVVGAGIGGLAAAIELASRGLSVEVLEADAALGGKAGTVTIDGVELDTGPSLFTLPVVFDALFRLAGSTLERELVVRKPSPSFRYLFPGGAQLEVFVSRDETLASVERALGRAARDELASFLAYAARIWTSAAPHFVYGEAPSLASLRRFGPRALPAMLRIDPGRSMLSAIQRTVRTPELRAILMRYATYNGSDVRRAPATLNCIAHVELSLGGFGIEGGMAALVRALVRAAERLGVRLRTGARVASIETRPLDGSVSGALLGAGSEARGVLLEDGTFLEARAVVANADAAHVFGELLLASRDRRRTQGHAPSMSAWNALVRAARTPGRAAHTVIFPTRYEDEFADVFDRRAIPREPTIYVCAQEVAHGRTGWATEEPLFVMANAPALAEAPRHRDDPVPAEETAALETLAETAFRTMRAHGVAGGADRVVWQRSPRELALRFPGTRGALYGAASNDLFAAFRRPANRVPGVRGLYLASGSAHPGGGVPMAALSGQHAARALAADLASR